MSDDTTATVQGGKTPDSAERLPPWSEIAAQGGIRPWVDEELRRLGLMDDQTDTSTLSDRARKQYKARREQERRERKRLMRHGWAAFKEANLVHLGVGIFYHDTADVDRYDLDDPGARRQDNDLPPLKDMQALAKALELPPARLRWLSYHREVDTGTHYRRWLVPKRDGGRRLISAPKPDLMKAQRWIARQITEHLPVHGAAHGFITGRGTVSNAAAHARAAVVVKFDLQDFYPTVTFPRVKGLMRKAGYGEQVATLLALLCTEAPREELEIRGKKRFVALGPRSLPQGAPTSPSITNTLCLKLDARLTGLARTLGFTYTRYADDLTFSWRGEAGAEGAPQVGKLMFAVGQITADEGFALHRKKTRVMRAGGRQKITGLVVNAAGEGCPRARVPRRTVRQLRAAIHNREQGRPGRGESLQQLKGMAAYVMMTDPRRGREFMERLDRLTAKS